MLKGPLKLTVSGNASEQRVTGGRLFIQSGRNLATKVMNGVEVIVRGDKTGLVGYDGTPVFPRPATPQAITLPPSTVSRQFHLVEHPNKPNNAIDHLLHSILRSATPDMVTKTLLTTFTYRTTVLEDKHTVVNTREEIISNVVTHKYHPTIEYTPSVKAETNSIFPDFFQSFGSSYLTSTLTTTYTYFNTFTSDSLPVILTSTETVSNVVTIPAYLNPNPTLLTPSFEILSESRIFETETYLTTYLFSKTMLDEETNQTQVLTTKETLTQVVVTEILIPAQSHSHDPDLLTPTPQKTLVTTSTFYTTFLQGTNTVIKSATEVNSNVVPMEDESQLTSPTFILDFPNYSYYTTVVEEETETDVKSRTQVVSEVLTEAISTSLSFIEPDSLKSSYFDERTDSTLLKLPSIHEIIPTRTIEGTYYPETKITKYPYWPKDEIEGIMDSEYEKSPSAIEEMKEEIHHIVNVLTDMETVDPAGNGAAISPDIHHIYRPLYSTITTGDENTTNEPIFEEITLRTPNDLSDDFASTISTNEEIEFDTGRPISHIPTPPLKSFTSTATFQTQMNPNIIGIFPDLPTRVRNPVRTVISKNKYPAQIAHLEHDTIYGSMNLGDISSIVDVYFNNVYVKNKLTVIPVVSGTGIFKRQGTSTSTSTSDLIVWPISASTTSTTTTTTQKPPDQIEEIFDLLSELTNEEVIPQPDYYDELNEEDGFKESDDEAFAQKIHNLSALASTTVNKKKANATDIKAEFIRTTTEESPTPTENIVNIEYEHNDAFETTTDTLTSSGSGDGGTGMDFIIPQLKDNPENENTEPEKDNNDQTGPDEKEDDEERPEMNQKQNMMKEVTEKSGGTDAVEESSERVTLIKWSPNGLPDQSDVLLKVTTSKKPPKSQEVQRTSMATSNRPTKITKKTTLPVDNEDSDEVTTKVYNLIINQNSEDTVEDDLDDLNKSDNEGGKTDEESQETNIQRRPPGIFSMSDSSGPSKSNLHLPAAPGLGVNTGSQIVTASTSGINWTPLLNLGALGLGGLGASTLTKLSPYLSSMAGYLKSGFVPGIARNDTLHYKQESRPPYVRYPSHPHYQEPNYIPIGKQKPILYRHPEDTIPRRPVISHADEPNFRPLTNNHEQNSKTQKIRPSGLRFENGRFPPTHNYNFQPSGDHQPDIFTQMGSNNINTNNPVGTRIVNGNHLEAVQPSSNIVKVISGNVIHALPTPVNRSPEPFLFGKKDIPEGDGQKRRPTFARPPPRSQENQGWKQQVILPIPPEHLQPESHEINTQVQIPLKVSAADIQKVTRPFIRPPPLPLPPTTPFHQTFPNLVVSPPLLQLNPEESINFPRPPLANPHQQFSGESPSQIFFNTFEKLGGAENPFNQQPRPGFGLIEKQRRPMVPVPIRSSSEEIPRPTEFHPQPPPNLSQFSPPPIFNFIPPTHYAPKPNKFQYNMDPPRSPQHHQHQQDFVHSSEEFQDVFGMPNRPQNHFESHFSNPNHNHNVAQGQPQQQISAEGSIEEGHFRPPSFRPPPSFMPNLDSGKGQHQNQQQSNDPFRPMIFPRYPHQQNEVNPPNPNLNSYDVEEEQQSQSIERFPTNHVNIHKAPVLLPGMQSQSQSNERLPTSNVQKVPVLLPGLQTLPWNPNSDSQEHNSEEYANNIKTADSSNTFKRTRPLPQRPVPVPPLQGFDPTPHNPPFKQRPSTIFIVQETYDPLPDSEEHPKPEQSTSSTFSPIRSTKGNSQEATSKKYPQLIIKEISTTPYTVSSTPKPPTTIVKVNPAFVRKSTTTSKPKTTESPISTNYVEPDHGSSFSGFVISPTMQDLINIGNEHSTSNKISESDLGFGEKIRLSDSNLKNKFSGSLATSSKKPSNFDIDKYFTNSGDITFGQTFSGSEDNESIIDPVNHQIIKSPFDSHKSTTAKPNSNSNLNQKDLSNHRNYSLSVVPTISDSSEEALLNSFTVSPDILKPSTLDNRLWWPTTFKPALTPPISSSRPNSIPSNEIVSRPETSLGPFGFHKPTTFKNIMRPTTFRPKRPQEFHSNLRNPLLSRPSQPGHVPYLYDDEEGLRDIKIKNVEIHKNPEYFRKPQQQPNTAHKLPITHSHPVLAFLPASVEYDEELEQSYEDEKPLPPSTSTNGNKLQPPPQRPAELIYETSEEQSLQNQKKPTNSNSNSIKNIFNNPKLSNNSSEEPVTLDSMENNKGNKNAEPENDTNETFELVPPGYPITMLRPPPPPNYGNGNNNDNRNRPFFRHPPPGLPQHSKRPGPFESITNIFRRPNFNARPNQQDFGPPGQPSQHLQPGFPVPHQHNNNQPPLRRPPPPPNNQFIRQPQPPRQNNNPPPPPPNSNQRQPGRPENNENFDKPRPIRPEINDNFEKVRPIPLNPNAGNQNQRPNQILPGLIRRPQQQAPGHDNFRKQITKDPQRPVTIKRPDSPIRGPDDTNLLVKPPLPPNDLPNDSEIYSYEDEDLPEENDVLVDEPLKISSTPKSTSVLISTTTTSTTPQNQQKKELNTVKPEVRPNKNEENKIHETEQNMVDQKPSAASDSAYDDYENENENDEIPPVKVEPEASPNRPIHIGGHLLNAFRPQPPRVPKPIVPQRGTFIFERPLIISDSSEFLQPSPPSPPKTEMEPPPIDSLRLKPSILELPSNGPIRYRPGRPGAQEVNLRPNLLRPDEDLLKPTLHAPKPTFHTVASVNHENKIIGTNVVVVPFSSKRVTELGLSPSSSATIKPTSIRIEVNRSESISPTKTLIGSVESVGLDFDLSSSIEEITYSNNDGTKTSVVEYSGGVLKTVILNAEKEKGQEKMDIHPFKSFTRTIIRTSQWQKPYTTEESSIRLTPTRTSQYIAVVSSTSQVTSQSRRPVTAPKPTESVPKPKPPYNPFIPSRGPPSAFVPWLRRSTSTTSTTLSTPTEISTISEKSLLSTFIPARDRITLKYNRTRPFSIGSESLSTTSTTETNFLATEESKDVPVIPLSSPPTIRTPFNYKPNTFRPVIRPNMNMNLENRDRIFGNNSISFVVSPTSQGSTTKNAFITTKKTTTTTTVNYLDNDKDDGDDAESAEVIHKIPLLTKNGTVSVSANINVNKVVLNRIPPTMVRKPIIVVSTLSSVSVLTSTMSTRMITHTETSTQTITETETTVVTSAGQPLTQTIMITKTLPPQTKISTIVGTVTVVNTVEVTPTTVRTTIFSEPTKSVTSFTGSPELTGPSRTTEKVLQGGVVPTPSRPVIKSIPSPPTTSDPSLEKNSKDTKKNQINLFNTGCKSNCSMQGNQMCRHYMNDTRSKCVCKPGYARMKLTTPCKPTFTYEMNLAVNHMEGMTFDFRDLRNQATDAYLNFITVTKDALDKAFLSTDLKRTYQGAEIMKIDPTVVRNNLTNAPEPKVNVDFLVQLTVNMTEERIKNHLIRTLKASNFSVGRTGVTTTKNMNDFDARDFNECSYPDFNDCSINADCINLKGSYLCQCQYGYKDRTKKNKPGRDCLEMAGCAECNYKGNCYPYKQGNSSCDCFRWYGGAQCQINLKILLMTIIGVGVILFVLVLLCGILLCKKNRRPRERAGSGRFMRYRSPTSPTTLERTAIMHDSSSDRSQSPPVRLNAQSYTPDSLLIDDDKGHRRARPEDANLMNFSLRNVVMDQQQDRSLTVVIPRAKIRPSSRVKPSTSVGGGGPETSGEMATNEKKFINYLDQGPYPLPPNKMIGGKTAGSSRQSTLQRNKEAKAFRKLSLQERRISSGALVSSGTEVSARGGMRRRSTGLEPELPFRGYEKTVSDVRSYDETTVRSHAKPLFASETSRTSCYSCKPPSYCAYSESAGHTMAEKDGASTVYTTQGKLFRMSQDTDSNLSSD